MEEKLNRYKCPHCSTSVYKVITYKEDEPCTMCGATVVVDDTGGNQLHIRNNDLTPYPLIQFTGVF